MALMDIFNGFRGVKTAAPPVAVTPPPVDPSKTNPTVPGDGTVKSTGSVTAIPPAGEGDKSPLEGYKDLWLNDPKDKKPASLEVNFPIDNSKMMEAARKLDFTKAISPATLALIAKGDPAGMLAGINEAAQAAFAQSSGATVKIVEGALNRQAEVFNKEVLPEALKRNAVAASLRTDNPVFDSAAVSPLVSMIENQMQLKHPTASAAEISKLARDYLQTASEAVIGTSGTRIVTDKPVATKKIGQKEDQDWGVFMGLDA